MPEEGRRGRQSGTPLRNISSRWRCGERERPRKPISTLHASGNCERSTEESELVQFLKVRP